ncbi:MAG: preprotein translocase subunit SecY [Defluviitaleaceae bacterium]|nr:preprotein translocase subunit SecY [Defluviitaleaceae bacterium]
MFSVFANVWKVEELRKKLLYILLILFIYRIGANIPLPGIDIGLWQIVRTDFTGQTLFATIVGGGFGTIFAMGIGPYITASIIMQLLTVAIPKLEQLKKEGAEGKKKLDQITRYLAIVMAFFQAVGMVFMLDNHPMMFGLSLFTYPNMFTYVMAVISLVTGTIFVMWLGELITEKGIGNGISFMIFANILSAVPGGIVGLYGLAMTGEIWLIVGIGVLALLFIALIFFAVLIQGGERRIPVQNSKKMIGATGRSSSPSNSYIPLKVNVAGVMSIIFALSLLQFPAMISQVVVGNDTLNTIVHHLEITMPIGAVLYMLLIVAFTFFYTSFAINPTEMAENMKKNGGFIPGIRPGKPTSDYISRTVYRLSWIGAGFYVTLAISPILFQWASGIVVGFGGTTLLIVVGVALELVKQLESQLLMRHYKGFLE